MFWYIFKGKPVRKLLPINYYNRAPIKFKKIINDIIIEADYFSVFVPPPTSSASH